MTAPDVRVGFIGLGTMGAPMAANIAKRGGFDLSVYDIDERVTRDVAQAAGARGAGSAAELADRDVIVTMLPTSAIVAEALLDPRGRSRIPAAEGTVFVDMSSSDPVETRATGAALEGNGYRLVDAPVSGARTRAESGTLTIMLGADDEAAAATAIPVIEAMSERIFRTGGLGTGHAMKALNNFAAATSFVATAEALVAARRFGLDPAVAVEIMNTSTGQSFNTLKVFPDHVIGGQYATGFALPLLTKDVRIAQSLEAATGHDSPVCDAVVQALEAALDALGNVDHSRAYEFWDRR